MICQDCAAAADWDGGLLIVDDRDVRVLEGHDRCVARNLGRTMGSTDCACQHRTAAREVSGG